LRLDPDFEHLAAEIAKTESMTTTVIDWNAVVQLSCALLRTKSKDYRVASYLVFGLFQTRGYEGLLTGVRMYEALIRNFWETAFPEKTRMRGRLGAAEWLNDRLASVLARKAARPASDDLILELEKAAQSFVAALAEFLGSQAPGFSEMIGDIGAKASQVRSRLAEAERAKEEQSRRAAAVASGEVTEVADAERVLDDCRERLFRVAAFYYAADASDPMSYRIRRSVTWGWMAGPPIQENGSTHIPPVSRDVLDRCEAWASRGEWRSIVAESESYFSERIFAFNLQRHCVLALAQLGEAYRAARDTVLAELASLCRRIPEIVDLKFNDGTPLADSATRSWIETEVMATAPGETISGDHLKQAGGMGAPDLEAAIAEARRFVTEGKLQEAVALFKEGIAGASQRRMRFLWRLQLARLCMDSGKPQLALPQLMSLDEDVSRFALEEWEPELSLEVVRQLFLCRQRLAAASQEKPPEAERQLQELYQRLCRLDVNAALAVEL
jgi:type VI secretion system protein VasJ